jgi:hypothetical protein
VGNTNGGNNAGQIEEGRSKNGHAQHEYEQGATPAGDDYIKPK